MPKCKSCKIQFKPNFFNQKFCFSNDDCRNEAIRYAIERKDKSFKKQCKKERREFNEKNKTRTQKINEVKRVFQAWIRERDKDLPCVSCGSSEAKLVDGGHYLKAEVYTGLIFDERNVHKQCRKCNRFKGGNELNYRDGLIKRYGVTFVESLESEKDKKRTYLWSDEELREIKEKYKILK